MSFFGNFGSSGSLFGTSGSNNLFSLASEMSMIKSGSYKSFSRLITAATHLKPQAQHRLLRETTTLITFLISLLEIR